MGTAEGNRKLRKERRDRGLCMYLGCKVLSGKDARCPEHAAGHAASMKLLRQKARVAA